MLTVTAVDRAFCITPLGPNVACKDSGLTLPSVGRETYSDGEEGEGFAGERLNALVAQAELLYFGPFLETVSISRRRCEGQET